MILFFSVFVSRRALNEATFFNDSFSLIAMQAWGVTYYVADISDQLKYRQDA